MNLSDSAFARRLAAMPAGLRGMGYMLASALTISGMNGVVTHLVAGMHAFEVTFFRQLLGSVFMAAVCLPGGLQVLHTRRFWLHMVRAVLNVVAMGLYFLGLTYEPMATVVALALAAPLFASLGAMVFLRERMTAGRWAALALGFAGSLVILRPGIEVVSFGAAMVLLSNMVWAVALVVIKMLSRTESAVTMTIYAAVLQAPLALVFAVFVWRTPTWAELLLLACTGVFGSIAQLCLGQAFREADATLVLPIDFTKLIWASLIGYAFFGQTPSLWVLFGGLVVFLGVFWNALQERRAP